MPRRKVGLIPPSDETMHHLPRFPHRSPQLVHRSKAMPRGKIGLMPNRTDLAAIRAKRKDRPKKKGRGLAPLRSAVVLVCADGGGDHAAPADVSRSEEGPHGGALAQYPALHGRYAEEVAKLDEERQEGPRELNRWDVALEIFTMEEAYRLRRIVDKVAQPLNERREALGLSVHDDDGGGDDLLDRAALPAGSNNGVTLLGTETAAFPASETTSSWVLTATSACQAIAEIVSCSCSRTMASSSRATPSVCILTRQVAMDMCGYGYDGIATINQQLSTVSRARRSMSMVSNASESSLPTATSLVHHQPCPSP